MNRDSRAGIATSTTLKRRWAQVVGEAIPLDTIISPYRSLLPPLLYEL